MVQASRWLLKKWQRSPMSSRQSKCGWRWVDMGQWSKCSSSMLGDCLYSHCGLGPMTSCQLALGIHIPPSSVRWVAHHPALITTTSPWEGEPGSLSLLEASCPERWERQEKDVLGEDKLPRGKGARDFLPSQNRGHQGETGSWPKWYFHLCSVHKVLQPSGELLWSKVHHLFARRYEEDNQLAQQNLENNAAVAGFQL